MFIFYIVIIVLFHGVYLNIFKKKIQIVAHNIIFLRHFGAFQVNSLVRHFTQNKITSTKHLKFTVTRRNMTVSRGSSDFHTRPVVALEWAAWFATLPYLFAAIIIVMTSLNTTPAVRVIDMTQPEPFSLTSDSRPATYSMRPAVS